MNELLNFENKKERDDFLIALVVIALFALLFWWLFGQNNKLLLVENLVPVVATIEKTDTDGDGVYDEDDKCPELAGTLINNGCPNDLDGDGIYDENDKCPNLAGNVENAGCPNDTDGDGVYDGKDDCPELAGVVENSGCPADADGDGVYDVNDNCPNRAGTVENAGCPEIKINEEERALLARAMESVEFNTGSAILKPNSKAILDQITNLMKKYPRYKLEIRGHTDDRGERQANMQLSENRAESCYNFLAEKGIEARRISFEGFGESKPLYSNDTEIGRGKNRRVEFNLSY